MALRAIHAHLPVFLLVSACGGKPAATTPAPEPKPGDDLVAKCEARDAAACKQLGRSHDQGYDGLAENKELAFGYMQQACDLADLDACTTVALWYGWGNGVARDEDKEYELMEGICKQSWADACYWMADGFSSFAKSMDPAFQEPGFEPPEDYGQLITNAESLAHDYLTQACGLGEESSCFLLRHGVDQDPDLREGHYWFLPEGCCDEPIPEGADDAYRAQFE